MKAIVKPLVFLVLLLKLVSSLSLTGKFNRRTFIGKTVATSAAAVVAFGGGAAVPTGKANAATNPEVKTTNDGKIKYVVKEPAREKASSQPGDIVAVEYTGYLTNGQIFDATHAEGKKNILMFKLGGNAVIPGVSAMVEEMGVGEKVQAIIPPELAFGEKGLCLESGECLIQPGSTLVYDIYLKRAAIPPP